MKEAVGFRDTACIDRSVDRARERLPTLLAAAVDTPSILDDTAYHIPVDVMGVA